jgi:hypothetical protein
MSAPKEIITDLNTIYGQLDALESITPSSMLIPGGSEERYHEIIEETYAALSRVETEVDVLREAGVSAPTS